MGTKERRQRESEDTRTKILGAAREMFTDLGYEAVTMRAIAERIEYTPAAIYHHFRDKDELFRELCMQVMGGLGQAFRQVGRIEDPVERIRRIGRAYVEFALENRSHYRFMFMTPRPLARPDGGVEEKLELDPYLFLRAAVAEAMAAGRFRPELTDPDQVALSCWGLVHGIASLTIVFAAEWQAKGERWPDAVATLDATSDAMLRGFLRETA